MTVNITMSVFENFIKDLLKENIITEYKASRTEVRDFYNLNYRKIANCSFHDFNHNLWKQWYIVTYTTRSICFDERWIDYLAKNVGGHRVNKKPFNENTYIDDKKCLLCSVSFANRQVKEAHIKLLDHCMRIQYVKNRSQFTTNNDISLSLIINDEKIALSQIKLKFPVKTDMNAKICIKNTSNKAFNIMGIIRINALVPDVTLQEEFEQGTLLKPSNNVMIDLHAYFEYSANIIFPIVIVTEVKGSNIKTFHLKLIEMEVTSEFSSLKPKSKYIGKTPDAFSAYFDMNNAVIPGIKPEPYLSYYKETLALKQFRIPGELLETFRSLATRYPHFIERSWPLQTNYPAICSTLEISAKVDQNNYFTNLEKLLHVEENQLQLDIRDYDTVSTLQIVKGSSLFELEVPGLSEARPSLLVNDKVYLKEREDDTVKFEGIVHKVLEKSVRLGLNQRFHKIFVPKKQFYIQFGFNRRSIRVEKQALALAHNHGIIPQLYPSRIEIALLTSSPTISSFDNRQLNAEQRLAVQNIVRPKNYPFIIFGPPGTGKTVTVVESVYQIWKHYPNSRILICAPSNAATNEVAIRLLRTVPKSEIFRLLGNVYAHDHERMYELSDIVNIQRDGTFYMPSMDDLLKYRIVMTTIVTAARLVNGGVPQGHFSHVFIDESGYATETQTLIPIAGILSNAENSGHIMGQIVLAGDPQQLGPLVHSSFAKYCGYGKSLLERLTSTSKLYNKNSETNSYDNDCVTKLLKNYRSHETILKIPNKLFYDDELEAVGTDLTNLFIGWKNLQNKKFPIIFHNVEGEDARDKTSPSFFNIQEVEQVVGYISELLSTKVSGIRITEKHIGVITPYRKQAEKLREACDKKKWKSILIGSVEQFQGNERLIIIISTVRSKNANTFEHIDQKHQLGFLKNPKRFNVALTRAKALLVVIGNGNVLKKDSSWCTFIRYCAENKSVTGKALN